MPASATNAAGTCCSVDWSNSQKAVSRAASTPRRADAPSWGSAQAATAQASSAWRTSSAAMLLMERRVFASLACFACQRPTSAPNVSRTQPSTAFSVVISLRERIAAGGAIVGLDGRPQWRRQRVAVNRA